MPGEGTHTLDLTDSELRIVENALHAFLDDFGHDQHDVLAQIRAVLSKLPQRETR